MGTNFKLKYVDIGRFRNINLFYDFVHMLTFLVLSLPSNLLYI